MKRVGQCKTKTCRDLSSDDSIKVEKIKFEEFAGKFLENLRKFQEKYWNNVRNLWKVNFKVGNFIKIVGKFGETQDVRKIIIKSTRRLHFKLSSKNRQFLLKFEVNFYQIYLKLVKKLMKA